MSCFSSAGLQYVIGLIIASLWSVKAFGYGDSPLLINGFIKQSVAYSDNPNNYDQNINYRGSYNNDSVVGLNISKSISSQWDAVLQLKAEGFSFQYDISTEWAFLKYTPKPWLHVKMGLQKSPFWLYSDYLNIGIAYPWITPPKEVYKLNPIESIMGMGIAFEKELGNDFVGTIEAFFGGVDQKNEVSNYDGAIVFRGKIDYGVYGVLTNDTFTLRASYAQGLMSQELMEVEDWMIKFWSAGLMVNWMDHGFFIAEFARAAEDNTTSKKQAKVAEYKATADLIAQSIAENGDDPLLSATYYDALTDLQFGIRLNSSTTIGHKGYYGTIGYEFNKWVPHYTYAVVDAPDQQTLLAGSQSNQIIGLRYNAISSVAIKLELHSVRIKDGDLGVYAPKDDWSPVTDIEHTLLGKLGVDAIF